MKRDYLRGRNAAVTGASSGIGRATAIRLAAEGMNLALIARNVERLTEVAREVQSYGVKAVVIVADTSKPEQARAAVDAAIDKLGSLDVFHCNAGIYFRCPARDLSTEQIRRVMETNFYGTLNCIYAVLPHMLEKKSGSIVVTVSMDGKKGVPPDAAYVASKFALNGFLQVLRQELRGTGVHVASIFPARIDTPQIAHVDCPAITPKYSPSIVADAVVRAVVHKKKEIMAPDAPCRLLVYGDAISPALGDWMVRAFRLDGTQNGDSLIKEEGLV